jgi:hypothetical protein
VDRDVIEAFGLTSLLEMLKVHLNRGFLTTLAERWYNDTNTFHLVMGKIKITTKDVYCILRVPVIGVIVTYNSREVGGIDSLRRIFVD